MRILGTITGWIALAGLSVLINCSDPNPKPAPTPTPTPTPTTTGTTTTDPTAACKAIPSIAGNVLTPCLPLTPDANATLGRIAAVWNTWPKLVCRYMGGMNWPVACGTAPNNADVCSADFSLAYDADWINNYIGQFGTTAIKMVFAHEWGHINQIVFNIGVLGTKHNELHADCQAGMYAAIEEAAGRGDNLLGTYMAMCAAGDPVSSPWWAMGAHGTCQERESAFTQGYSVAKQNIAAVCANRTGTIINVCGN